MGTRNQNLRGFTLLEVTFATGILFLSLVLLLGALSSIALTRELGERRILAARCLTHCLEQLHSQAPTSVDAIQLSPPADLAERCTITVRPVDDLSGGTSARIRVTTQSTRGHVIEVEALYVIGGPVHAP